MVVWFGTAGYIFAWSFQAGCLIKTMVTHFGGFGWYQRLKPAMYGLIAAQMVAGALTLAAGIVYYLITGDAPAVRSPV